MADGRVVIEVELSDKNVSKGVSDVDKRLGGLGKSGRNAAMSIGRIASALGLVALAAGAINLVRKSLDGAIERFDTLNQFPRVMQMIGFDADRSEKAIQRLSNGVQGLPTRLDSVASTAQNIAVMTNDLDGAVETTLALNNAFLASGASTADAERGLEQYVQMLAKGEVDLQSWRTLQETMGVALNTLAEDFGFTGKSAQNDLYDALKEGEITFDEFNSKLIEASDRQGGFADMALTASEGIRTSWENIKTAVVIGVTNVLEEIDKLLGGTGDAEDGFEGIVGVLERVKDSIYIVFGYITDTIPDVVEWIKGVHDTLEPWVPLIKVVATAIGVMVGVLATLGTAMNIATIAANIFNLTLWANPIALIIAAVIALAAVIFLYWDEIKEFTLFTWNAIKTFFVTYWETIKALFTAVFKWIDDKTGGAFSGYFELVKRYMGMAWENIKSVLDWVKNTFKNVLAFLKALVSGDFEGMKRAIQNQMENSRKLVTNILGNIRKYFGDILGKIYSNVRNRFNNMRTAISNVFNNIRNSITNSINNVKTTISNGINRALDVVRNIGRSFYNAGRNIITNIANGIRSAISSVTSAISSVTSKIRNFLPFSPAKDGPLKDIDKLDFGGTIADSIDKGKKKAMQAMGGLAGTLSGEIKPEVSLRGKSINDVLGNLMPAAVATGATGTVERTKREDDERVIVVQPNDIYLDGREVSRGTAKYDNEQFGNISARQRRMSFGRKRV